MHGSDRLRPWVRLPFLLSRPTYFPLGLCSITSRLKEENPTRIEILEITFWFHQCDDRHSLSPLSRLIVMQRILASEIENCLAFCLIILRCLIFALGLVVCI